MKISEMNNQELIYFEFLCKKFDIQTSSTEELREVIKGARNQLDEQKKELENKLDETKKYLNEIEKMIGNLEKGGLRK
jgi:ribosome-binding protein aMBF1 (putative translation factor)